MISVLMASLALVGTDGSNTPVYDAAHAQACVGQFAFLADREGRLIPTLAPEESLVTVSGDLEFWGARLGSLAETAERATQLRDLGQADAALSLSQVVMSAGLDAARGQVGAALAQCRADRGLLEADGPAVMEPTDG